ncbi:unnamed protein product [Alopecurus aequalis]
MGNKRPFHTIGTNSTSSVDKPTSETSSRCLTERFTTAHNFEVIMYSQLEGMADIGKSVTSSTFSVGGYDWNIRMYPNGWKKEDNAGYMSVCLSFRVGTAGVKAKFAFSLLEKDRKVFHLRNTTQTFHVVGEEKGWSKFIDKSKLQELISRNDDCFIIRCVLTVIEDPYTQDLSIVPIPEPDLHTHFASMLKDGEGMDVTFSVRDQLFNAHRCVLAARSSVFKAELFGQMKETTMNCIRIDDMEPAIFEALLHFIYTDSLPDSCDVRHNATLQHLLVAADRYGLQRLKALCEEKLCQKIDVRTVATTLALAEQHHSAQLKSACLRYLSSRDVLRIVKETDGFKHLAASCPIMTDILDKLSEYQRSGSVYRF